MIRQDLINRKIILCPLASPLPATVHWVSALGIYQTCPPTPNPAIIRNNSSITKSNITSYQEDNSLKITFLLYLVKGHMTPQDEV